MYNEKRITELFNEAQSEYERYSKWAETSFQKMLIYYDILQEIEKKAQKRKNKAPPPPAQKLDRTA
jgi:uncharacterized membrane protein